MKKILSVILAMLMIASFTTLIAHSEPGDGVDNFNKFWRVSAMKWQSQGEYKHIQDFYKTYYADNNYQPHYEITSKGGVKLTALTYKEAPGAMSSQCIGSKIKCPLDGVEVKMRFDDFVMDRLVNLGSTIYVLWCTEPIGDIVDGYYNDYFAFCQGMEQAFYVGQNGLRDSMPMGAKGLSICISGSGANEMFLGTQVAGSVSISCFDGEYVNQNDGHLGKRWTFGYRSGEIISQPVQRIDFSDGLTVKVRADEKLGFVVGITDSTGLYREFCDTSKVSYFPDLPGTGNNWTEQEPDFSCLKGLTGYLYIGASASAKDNKNVITIESVNGISMDADNQLHTHTPDGNVQIDQPYPCKDGVSYETCTECGDRCNIETVPATAEHSWGDWITDEEPTCVAGKNHRVCDICNGSEDGEIEPVDEHTPGDWMIKTNASADKEGTAVRICEICKNVVESKSFTFTDIDEDAWYVKYILFNYANGMMSGMSEGSFSPDTPLTRAQFVTMLAAIDGVDLINYTGATPFNDVSNDAWFSKYVQWANENGIANGISETDFGPDQKVTREQIALMLMKYAEIKGFDVTLTKDVLNAFEDRDDISGWAVNAVCWAIENGLIKGVTETLLSPKSFATRAQIAVINMGFTAKFPTK